MAFEKRKVVPLMQEGLEMEYASQIQYLTQAAITTGPYAEALMARFKEIAQDEMEHADILRRRLAALGETPSTKVGDIQIHPDSMQAVKINLKYERDTVEFYRKLLNLIPHDEVILYEAIEHVLEDSQEHVEELERLIGSKSVTF
ncbi:MAG TPA: ferritin-like domain-containing protein [bacterium]